MTETLNQLGERPPAHGATADGAARFVPGMIEAARAAATLPVFRGEIWEANRAVPMGRGYANEGKPFDIESACYLKPVFRAIKDPDAPLVVCLAAVQMLKTFACMEEPAAYFIEHDPGDMNVYIGGDDTSRDQARGRLIPRLRSIPGVASQIASAEAADRWDITTQEFYLPGMILRICGLNVANTQRVTLRRVLISDAYLSEKSGLIDQAIARTTQHGSDKKIIVESQGGETGDDFDRLWKTTDMGLLHVVCPWCGTGQPFEFHRERPEDFEAVLPKTDLQDAKAAETAQKELTKLLRSAERRHCGFKRGDEDLIKRGDGSYDEAEIRRQTYYECYHCGQPWRDTPETRKQLDESSYYVASNPGALSGHAGFWWPSWAGRRLAWGGEECMLGYLRAKKILEETGNVEPLKQWQQKRAGRPWDPWLARPKSEVSPGSYDPNEQMPDEHSRNMAVDCQLDQEHKERTGASVTGWFWYIVRVFDKRGNSKQLARGFCKSWEAWQSVQKHWGVPNDRVMIDALFAGEQVIAKAVECRQVIKLDRPSPIWKTTERTVTWKLLAASPGKSNFKGHRDGLIRVWSPEMPVYGTILDAQGKPRRIPIMRILFNKVPVQLQVDALYSGAAGMTRFEVLGREQLRLPDGTPDAVTLAAETGMKTYQNQMSSQYYDPDKNKYVELRPDDHYYWCEQALWVRAGMDGLLGHVAVYAESSAVEVKK